MQPFCGSSQRKLPSDFFASSKAFLRVEFRGSEQLIPIPLFLNGIRARLKQNPFSKYIHASTKVACSIKHDRTVIYLCAFFTVHQVFYLQLTKLMKLKSVSGTTSVCDIEYQRPFTLLLFPITMKTFDTRWWVFEARKGGECYAFLAWTMAVLIRIVSVGDQANNTMVSQHCRCKSRNCHIPWTQT